MSWPCCQNPGRKPAISRRATARETQEPRRTGFDLQGQHFVVSSREQPEVVMSKSSDKPKKQQKKKPQRTLKERRSEKRAAKKLSSGSFLPADR